LATTSDIGTDDVSSRAAASVVGEVASVVGEVASVVGEAASVVGEVIGFAGVEVVGFAGVEVVGFAGVDAASAGPATPAAEATSRAHSTPPGIQ
jgi:hypothetical protein